MPEAIALDAPRPVTGSRVEQFGLFALMGVAGALQFSIAAAQILLAVAVLCWLTLLVTRRERLVVPFVFWPLLAYAAITLVSTAFSPHPLTSLYQGKQLLLLVLVPLTCRFMTGRRPLTMMTVILTCAAVSAAVGIVQYGILHYDNLGQRPQGTLGHYMTYSGLLMLVIGVALARVLFGRGERTWAALVMPALAVAVALTFTRGAWVGACVATALLLSLKDFRLLAVLPIAAALFFALAPATLTTRFVSMFDLKDPTVSDRVTMLRIGERMIRAHPLAGIGPNMVQRLYVDYRGQDALAGPDGVEHVNPHLHNNYLQIAAERGLPALAVWLWFIVGLLVALARRFHQADDRFVPAAALAAVAAMLAAGLFEYNFGDSEFLMLFLMLVTLPFAAARSAPA
jgi:O-antigen ligase